MRPAPPSTSPGRRCVTASSPRPRDRGRLGGYPGGRVRRPTDSAAGRGGLGAQAPAGRPPRSLRLARRAPGRGDGLPGTGRAALEESTKRAAVTRLRRLAASRLDRAGGLGRKGDGELSPPRGDARRGVGPGDRPLRARLAGRPAGPGPVPLRTRTRRCSPGFATAEPQRPALPPRRSA